MSVEVLKSPAYYRMVEAGFSFGEPEEREMAYVFPFTCVCGKREWAAIPKEYIDWAPEPFDLAQELELMGAVSVAHLRADGYSEDQIREIRKPYEK